MITTNFGPTKTQIVHGSDDDLRFSIPRTRTRKSGGANGDRANLPPDLEPRLEPAGREHVELRTPADRAPASLPASLEDWLACGAALEIRRSGRNRTEDGKSRQEGVMDAESIAAQKSTRRQRAFVNGL